MPTIEPFGNFELHNPMPRIRSQGAKIFFSYTFNRLPYFTILLAPMYFSQVRFKYRDMIVRVESIFFRAK